ncbi:MAG TPA: NADH-quinone oxidoreductase subunit L [Myxococcales bacterium]|nr:NADH-quinone oxidoreductase subunit L [Myxococcales bacterium]
MTSPFEAQGIADSLWLIIALPLLGAAVCGLFGRWLGRANVGLVACSSVAGSFLLSVLAFWAVNDRATVMISPHGVEPFPYAMGVDYGVWFSAGAFTTHFGLMVDHLSGTMLMVVTGVGFLIHVYSTEYMAHDPGYARYFAYLNLFVAMMLTLVLADNMVLTFVGWEGVGLCSYLLIGFWYTDAAKAWAGRKAFITNRIGDFGFIIGASLLSVWVWSFSVQAQEGNFVQPGRSGRYRQAVSQLGPLSYQGLEATARLIAPAAGVQKIDLGTPISQGPLRGQSYGSVLTAVLLLFLLGAAGKSAQLPLYVWLPDAMAGPTPVSALIHAATMVTAGVYLFARLGSLLLLSPFAMAAVALVGAATALFAALIAFAQDDIKKVLAYSTVSQLGFMFMGVGMGVFWAAILHLVTHAFFKACLFLGAGSVMHGNGDETDIKKLGGLRKQMPWTWITFAVATAAITGVIPLSGFFSKDAILDGVRGTELLQYPWVPKLVWALGLLTALCTAFYMSRLYLLTFEGERSKEARVPQAHESGTAITFPLLLLASLSVIALVYALPLMNGMNGREPVMENFLSPVFIHGRRLGVQAGTFAQPHAEGLGGLLFAWVLALLVAWGGAGLAFWVYRVVLPRERTLVLPAWARRIQTVVRNKFYVDELYDLLIVRPVKFGSFILYRVVDTLLIDRLVVRGVAWVTYQLGSVIRYFQTGDAQSYAAVMAVAVLAAVAYAFYNFK